MDDNIRQFYGGSMDKELVELAERLTDRINEDASLKSVILFFAISFILLAFLILFICLFMAVGCIGVLIYFIWKTISSFTGGANRN